MSEQTNSVLSTYDVKIRTLHTHPILKLYFINMNTNLTTENVVLTKTYNAWKVSKSKKIVKRTLLKCVSKVTYSEKKKTKSTI